MGNPIKTILIVDDDEDFLLQLQMQLERDGFDVITAHGQDEAEERLDEIQPDLVICDLMMENMDAGFVLSHRIKRLSPDLPIIIVTGVTSETGMDFALANRNGRTWVKAEAVLAKPLRYEQLRAEIDKLARWGREGSEVA